MFSKMRRQQIGLAARLSHQIDYLCQAPKIRLFALNVTPLEFPCDRIYIVVSGLPVVPVAQVQRPELNPRVLLHILRAPARSGCVACRAFPQIRPD